MEALNAFPPLPPPAPAAPRTSPRRRRRWLPIAAAVALAVAGLAGAVGWAWDRSAPTEYRTASITTGDLRETVSATGTLSAVTTVEVGTQVSGVVTELLVDYNDTVRAGQVIARIDPTLLAADVELAKATLVERQAQEALAQATLSRTTYLSEHDAASPAELEQAKQAASSAHSQVRSAKVALERAERNLGYATITAPIDGIVVDRTVNVGQTVNAGTSAPTLYMLAGDLHRMQILATVDEADIGQVAAGQPVDVTVAAYPDARFEGAVRQVRLQSTTTDNVVTYTVVVDVDNEDGRLLPGMTANVSFVVAEANDVALVPASALRFRPTTEATSSTGTSGDRAGRGGGSRDAHRGVVWVLGEDGTPERLVVTTGISDGSRTAISGEGVTPGLEVITGLQGVATATATTSNPFASSSASSGRGPGRPGGF